MQYNPVSGLTQASGGIEIFTSLLIVFIVTMTAFLAEYMLKLRSEKTTRVKSLLDYTASSEETLQPIRQDITKYKEAIPIGLSVNERSGIEFAYSFYLMVGSGTFTGEKKLKHVFHKGYPSLWPLMSPGVFIWGHTNTMRIVMSTIKNPFTHVDIQNIPIDKWFHVVLNCYKGGLDVYVNGNMANRITFKHDVPYQNFQDIQFFSFKNMSLSKTNIPVLSDHPDATLDFQGHFTGMLSSLEYTRYAMSIYQIQALMAKGPSKKRKVDTEQLPPYMADNWWSNQQS